MRRSLLLAFVLLFATAVSASAAGVGLAWNACTGDGGSSLRTFACDTNVGSHVLVGSFVLDADLAQVNGNELVVDLCTATASLPDWWQYKNAGSCRLNALSIAAQDGVACPDLFQGQASMNIAAYQLGLQGPNSARILCVNAVPSFAVQDLVGGQEYGIARWQITNQRTVGTGACGGCTAPACIVFNSANITTMGNANNTKLVNPFGPGANYAMWQSPNPMCPFIVPTRTVTWSKVKSLYR